MAAGTGPLGDEAADGLFSELAEKWRPPVESSSEVVGADAPAEFSAILDEEPVVLDAGDPLPPLWHWFMFLPRHRQSALGPDGHPHEGTHLPPIPGRRRMFGGGRISIDEPLRCGERVDKRSEVSSVAHKHGRHGPLLLVTTRHLFSVAGAVRLTEEQDIIYLPPQDKVASPEAPVPEGRGDSRDGPPQPAQPWQWGWTVRPDTIMLFRFSALTRNAHRIHYDYPYASEVEGYPKLLVHGPLSALLLLELPRREARGETVASIDWRARRPLYVGDPIELVGRRTDDASWLLEANSPSTSSAVTATVRRR